MSAAARAHAVLGVHRGASAAQIRAAFRKAVLAAHPDTAVARGAEPQPRRLQEVVEAYAILRSQSRAGISGGGSVYYDAAAEARLRERAEAFRRHYYSRGARGEAVGGLPAAAVRAAEALLHPRSLLLLPLLGVAAWLAGSRDGSEGDGRVPAWFNPATRRWEAVALSDTDFAKHRSTLRLMPAEFVAPARTGTGSGASGSARMAGGPAAAAATTAVAAAPATAAVPATSATIPR